MNFAHNLSICFDLDGTLVDTAPDLVRVLNDVIATQGLQPADFNGARNRVGYGAKALIRHAYAEQNRDIDDNLAQDLLVLFLEQYEAEIAKLSTPFPDVIRTLGELKAQGARLSVCTNKPGYLARPLLDALNMTRFFERIIGSRDGVRTKPHADHVFAAAGHRRTDRIVMVGDSVPDVMAARAAKVPVVVMTYGYANMAIARLRADRTLRQFRELPAALEALSGKGIRRNSL